jgi:hypothetical protein
MENRELKRRGSWHKRLSYPEHTFPIQHVVISAAQNVYSSQRDRDKDNTKSINTYLTRGLVPSCKFSRTADAILEQGYDENKAMFPIYGRVPVFVPTTIAALESGLEVAVVGSREVGKIVDALRDYYRLTGRGEQAERLKWAPEYNGLEDIANDDREIIAKNRRKLKLGNSISSGAKALNLSEHNAFVFAAGDIMFYDYLSVIYDPDTIHNSIVIDFNGKETIHPPFPRNYYHIVIDEDGRRIHIKEPNVWVLGTELDFGLNADVTYENREKGRFGIGAVLKMVGSNMLKNPDLVRIRDIYSMLSFSIEELVSRLQGRSGLKRRVPSIFLKDLESLGEFINMSPVRFKAEHTDYLRLKDIDAAHDYVFYRLLLRDHIDDIFPSVIAQMIKEFDAYLVTKDITGDIVVVSEFPERMNDLVCRLQRRLCKSKIDYELEQMFDSDGEFTAKPSDGEDLEAAVEISKRDKERFLRKHSSKRTPVILFS